MPVAPASLPSRLYLNLAEHWQLDARWLRWDCAFVTFTHALKKLAIEAMKELGHKPGQLHIETVDKMNVLKKKYDIIFVDEVQDLTVQQISKLRGLADRFVYAGDLNQSIYLQAAPSAKIREALGSLEIVKIAL